MNMKKIIGVLVAAVLGISAMMLPTYAEETNTITYNLVSTTYTTAPGTVTYTASLFADADVANQNGVIQIYLKTPATVDPASAKWTVTGYTFNTRNHWFNYQNLIDGTRLNELGASTWVSTDKDTGSLIQIPLNKTGINTIDAERLYIDVKVTCNHYNTTDKHADVNAAIAYNYNTTMTVDTNNDTIADAYANNVYADGAWNATAVALETIKTEYTKASTVVDKRFPFATNIDMLGGTNILAYLENDKNNLIGNGESYNYVIRTINDILQNYNDVTFTFKTATEDIVYEDKVGYYYKKDADDTYLVFDQHLYDTTAPYFYDWNKYNLFSGALVVNENLTMTLNDIDAFEVGGNSISFTWDDIVNGTNINDYATFLANMQLKTSALWFWDTLEITYTNTCEDDVSSAAGAVVEEEVIEEEPVVEEEIPVEENPKTGNTPIAFGVVPVALAAAAIIAKKSK